MRDNNFKHCLQCKRLLVKETIPFCIRCRKTDAEGATKAIGAGIAAVGVGYALEKYFSIPTGKDEYMLENYDSCDDMDNEDI